MEQPTLVQPINTNNKPEQNQVPEIYNTPTLEDPFLELHDKHNKISWKQFLCVYYYLFLMGGILINYNYAFKPCDHVDSYAKVWFWFASTESLIMLFTAYYANMHDRGFLKRNKCVNIFCGILHIFSIVWFIFGLRWINVYNLCPLDGTVMYTYLSMIIIPFIHMQMAWVMI